MGGANKGGLGGTNEVGMGGTDIEIEVGVDGVNKSGMGGANKSGVGGANIGVGKKASTKAVANIDNSKDDGGKVTDQHLGLASLIFATLAATNCANNSNLAIFEKTPSDAATSTFDKFFITFAAFANTTLKRELNVYKFNPFLFVVNHQ